MSQDYKEIDKLNKSMMRLGEAMSLGVSIDMTRMKESLDKLQYQTRLIADALETRPDTWHDWVSFWSLVVSLLFIRFVIMP